MRLDLGRRFCRSFFARFFLRPCFSRLFYKRFFDPVRPKGLKQWGLLLGMASRRL